MENKKIKTIEEVVSDIEKGKSTFYFLVIDSVDAPNATIENIYNQAKTLQELGHNVTMLVETNVGNPNKWLGTDFHTLKIKSATKVEGEIKIKPCDFLIIPEVFATVLKSTVNVPYKRIVICQNYELALEVLEPGQHWLRDFNIKDVIVTNENMAKWVEDTFIGVNTEVLPIKINKVFKRQEVLRTPKFLIAGRSNKDVSNFGKEFILRNPMFSWIPFQHVSHIPTEELAKEMTKALALIWIDGNGSFGTLPLEAMKCGLPVIGLIPEMVPEWMTNENGTWCRSKGEMQLAANLITKAFLDDTFDFEDIDESASVEKYNDNNFDSGVESVYKNIINRRIEELKEKNKYTE